MVWGKESFMTEQNRRDNIETLRKLSKLEGREIPANEANLHTLHNLRFELATEFDVSSWDLIAAAAGTLGCDTQRLQVSL